MRFARTLTAACVCMLVPLASEAAKPVKPLPAPPPLVVVDANGNIAARVMGNFTGSANQPTMWVAVSVNGVLSAVGVSKRWKADGSGLSESGLMWVPQLQGTMYFASADCSGAPLIADTGWDFGLRPAVADWRGTVTLHVGADAPSSPQSYQSYRRVTSCNLGGCSYSCVPETTPQVIYAIPTETSIDLDATYPAPLQIQ